jgi:hypothetical protein
MDYWSYVLGESASKMIELAIGEGVPLYNAGHAGDCARVYMATAKNILAMENHGMCSSTVTHYSLR